MKIGNDSFVEVAYTLTVDGQIVDKADATRPLPFIFGKGFLLPKFEANLLGKEVGGKVSFTLTPEDGYGEHKAEYMNAYPREMFNGPDGSFDESVVFEGAMLQLTTPDGQPLMAKVSKIGDTEITLDFNPPMAGKTLNFDVEVLGVRASTAEDLAMFMGGNSCGCGDGCGEGDGCGCGEGDGCGCGDGKCCS
ncbi:MAG: peptidylprolyl isomerase [Rikenellaceae bacterium]